MSRSARCWPRSARAALKTYREAARKDAGAVSLEVLQRIDRPNQFVVLGSWTNQMAFDAHAAGDHVKKLNEKLATTLAAPNDTRQHNGLAVAPAKSAARTRSTPSPMWT